MHTLPRRGRGGTLPHVVTLNLNGGLPFRFLTTSRVCSRKQHLIPSHGFAAVTPLLCMQMVGTIRGGAFTR